MYAAIRYVATFHESVEDLVDLEEISEANKIKLTWLFGLEDAEGCKHSMIRVDEGKK